MEFQKDSEVIVLQTVRMYFIKRGDAKYLSHLDLVRCFTRAIKRSCIEIWYTEGFNNRPYLLFPLPLSLGIESEHEVVDIRLVSTDSYDDIKSKLNEYLPCGVKIIDCKEATIKHNEINAAEYIIEFNDSASLIEEIIKKEIIDTDHIIVEKKTKKSSSFVDIRSQIHELSYSMSDNTISVSLRIDAGNLRNLNPIVVVNKIISKLGFEVSYTLTRVDILTKDYMSF